MIAPQDGRDQALHPDHLANLRGSGLTDPQIRACGFYTETNPAAVAKLLNWKHPALDLGPCLCIPFTDRDGRPTGYVRVKPSCPRQKDGKVVKYESPVGAPNRAYMPPATRAKIADVSAPVLITEGEKKAAAADQHGFLCIGLVGVDGWQMKRETAPDGRKRGDRKLIPDLAALDWSGRTVHIVYDSEAVTKPEVQGAECRLAEALRAAGADVSVVRLPDGAGGAKVGLDDFLLAHGPHALRGLLDTRTPHAKPDAVPAARRMASPPWPDAIDPEAFHGLTGKFVSALEPATEADPAALLVQFLVGAGNAIGRTAHAVVEGDRHYCNEFAVLVGRSAKGRKGTSLGRVKSALSGADPEWAGNRIMSGLSTGEGLIWQVRDPIEKQEPVRERGQPVTYETVTTDEGVADKRLLVTEPEFAGVLKQTERHGNTLSPVVRCAWDSGDLRSLTKTSPAKATGAHVSVIGHITSDELRRLLSATESANGFANRFLWACVKRSKFLPEGGTPDLGALAAVERELVGVLAFARGAGEIKRDDEAREVWRDVYPTLSGERYGLAGSLLGRAEAHVLRLSVLYAVLDRSDVVAVDHLCAALAVWKYCEASVLHLFGSSTGNPTADEILTYLRSTTKGATRTEIRELVGARVPADRIASALAVLHEMGLARPEHRETGGRPSEVWTATGNGGVSRG
jgi:hypothetical protein